MAATNKELVVVSKDAVKQTKHYTSLAAGKKIWRGSVNMQIDGVVRPLVKGADLIALATLVNPNNVANGGIYTYAKQNNVRISLVDPTANSQPLRVRINTNVPGFVEVIVLLATDNAGTITSTANDVCDAIKGHALAQKYLTVRAQGNGSGVVTAAAPALVKYISVVGVSCATYDNSLGQTDLTIPEMAFECLYLRCLPLSTDKPDVKSINSEVLIDGDDQTIAATIDGFSLTALLVDIDMMGNQYCKIGTW